MYECIAYDQVRCYQTLQVLTPSANFARLGLGLVGLWTLSPQSRARGKRGECRGRRAEPPRPLKFFFISFLIRWVHTQAVLPKATRFRGVRPCPRSRGQVHRRRRHVDASRLGRARSAGGNASIRVSSDRLSIVLRIVTHSRYRPRGEEEEEEEAQRQPQPTRTRSLSVPRNIARRFERS